MHATLVLFALFVGVCLAIPFSTDFNVEQNEKEHHTGNYKYWNKVDPNDDKRMIVRRGQKFTIFLDDQDSPVYFQLIPYDSMRNQEYRKYTINVPLVSTIQEDPTHWQTARSKVSSGKAKYDIYVPYQAPVSNFHWVIVNGTSGTTLTNELIVLFNPWSPKDDVYLSDLSKIQEYVLSTDSLIWYGNSYSAGSMGWDYAQFDYSVLEVTLYFLSSVEWSKRGDISIVSRALSSWVNVNDNNGLVWGKWFGSYDDGKSPTYWTGSLELYQQYRKTRQGVKYGQCWVFGGCLTSAGRTLGIPARTITNFDSAHEEQSSGTYRYAMAMDEFLDASGTPQGREGGSIWNFHVWCEFWMNRRDLDNSAFVGWQAVDSTPQERSDGLMQMGPSSVNAVKMLDRSQPYDTDFVASEVGCKVNRWIAYNTGKQPNPTKPGYWLLEVDADASGHKMSTKAVGLMSREDITKNYKTVVARHPKKFVTVSSGISFEIVAPESVNAGQNFSLIIKAQCPGCSPTSTSFLEITGLIQMLTYTGNVVRVLRSGSINATLNAPYVEQSLTIYANEYTPFMSENHVIEYFAFVKFYENGVYNGTYSLKSGRFGLVLPDLVLVAKNRTADKFLLDVKWTNPLPMSLSQGILRIYGSTVADQDIWVGNIKGYQTIEYLQTEVYHYDDEGKDIMIFAKLLSKELPAINGLIILPLNGTSVRVF